MRSPRVESLEPRQLLAVITGRVFSDADGDRSFATTEKPVAGAGVYVDKNRDGVWQSTEPSGQADMAGAYRISRSTLKLDKTYYVRTMPVKGYASAARTAVQLTGNTTTAPDLAAWKWATVNLSAYLDANKNGKRDSGEAGLDTITYFDDVNLHGLPAGNPIYGPGDVTLRVRPGLHRLESGLVIGYTKTGIQDYTKVYAGGETTEATFGFYLPPTYSGYVYQDKNVNGKRDAGEGLAGRYVFADRDGNGHADEGEYRWETDADGFYQLQLTPGAYTIRQILPDGWTSSANYNVSVGGTNDTNTARFDFTTTQTAIPTLGTITGSTFADVNGNGKQDSGEGKFVGSDPAEIVYIDYDRDGNCDGSDTRATLNADGTFTFAGVLPGSYRIAGFGYEHNVFITKYHDVVVSAGKTSDAGAFGVQKLYEITISVIDDVDADGVVDPQTYENNVRTGGDVAVENALVYADLNHNDKYDPDTEPYGVVDSRGIGGMLLTPGTYTIKQVLADHTKQTGFGSSGFAASSTFNANQTIHIPADVNDKSTSQASIYFLETWVFTPDPKTAAIHGFLYDDANRNDQYDAGEQKLDGEKVFNDLDDSGVFEAGEPFVITHDGGKFDFTGLPSSSPWIRTVRTPTRLFNDQRLYLQPGEILNDVELSSGLGTIPT